MSSSQILYIVVDVKGAWKVEESVVATKRKHTHTQKATQTRAHKKQTEHRLGIESA